MPARSQRLSSVAMKDAVAVVKGYEGKHGVARIPEEYKKMTEVGGQAGLKVEKLAEAKFALLLRLMRPLRHQVNQMLQDRKLTKFP